MRFPKAVGAGIAVAIALTTSSAFAAGINLSWTDCGTFGQLQRNFACNSNSGSNTLVGSAIAPVAMGQLNGQASVLNLQTNQAALSDWWQLAAGGCRGSSNLTGNFDFTTSTFNCADPWGGLAIGGISYTPLFGGPNRARIRTVCAIPGSTSINATSEYYFFKVTITNARSAGAGACAGCTDGACIVFNSIQLTQPLGVGDYLLTNAISSQYATWQGGAGSCPQATPARASTWGSVKALYR